MIILAKVVPYGGNSVRYALEKEKAKTVKVNHMPEDIDAASIWYMMKNHCRLYEGNRTIGRKLERFMVTFVISPSKDESASFTMDDWARLQDEALEVLDAQEIIPKGMGKKAKTNFRNSMNVGGLHSDSKSGTLHLHIDCCRVDLDGKTNDVHDIHERAMKAAEVINMRHGWKQPEEIREMRKQEIADYCDYTLRNMPQFDIDKYFRWLRLKGYEVNPRYDRQKHIVGYTIGRNASVFKASEIGRKYMVSQLETTWKKLHPAPAQIKMKPADLSVSPMVRPFIQATGFTQQKPISADTLFSINVGDEVKKILIPNGVKDVFFNEAQAPEDNNAVATEDVANIAMLLFAGYVDAATSMSDSCGGGGSTPQSGWGKKDDEDDLIFVRRCLQMAHAMCMSKPRRRSFHR